MPVPLRISFKVRQYQICNAKIKVNDNNQEILTFTIQGSEIIQSRQLNISCRYILRTDIYCHQQLCAFQIILLYKKLGKIAQNISFQVSQFSQILVARDPSFWDNIGLVAAQIGLNVLSIQTDDMPTITQFLQCIEDYDLQYFSFYNNFDTLEIFYPDNTDKFNFHENQVLIQLAAIKYHEKGDQPLLLPQIFGYSAFLLFNTYYKALETEYYKTKHEDFQVGLLLKIFKYSNRIYNGDTFENNDQQKKLKSFHSINLFQIPLHFIDTGICLVMFQQLCQISYIFKAEYFAILSKTQSRYSYRLNNAVIIQSSKSGKSVALYTQYFFNLLIGDVPILLNKNGSKNQPLYYYKTGSFHEKLEKVYQNTFALQDLKNFNLTILNDICDFHSFQLESLNYIDYLNCKMNIFIDNMQNNFKKVNGVTGLDAIRNLKYGFSIEIYFDLLKKYSFFIYEGDIDTSGITDYQVLLYDTGQSYKKRPIILVDECLDSQKQNYSQCIKLCQMIFFQYQKKLEDLGQQCYFTIQNILQDIQNKHYNDVYANHGFMLFQITYQVIFQLLNTYLLQKVKSQIVELGQTAKYLNQNIDVYQLLENIIESINSKEQSRYCAINNNLNIIIDYFNVLKYNLTKTEYTLMAIWYLRLQKHHYDIIDELILYSPQILNIQDRIQFKYSFFYDLPKIYINRKNYQEEFEYYFFKFIMSLFNPRTVETLFWKTFQMIGFKAININSNNPYENGCRDIVQVSTKFWTQSINDKIIQYFNSEIPLNEQAKKMQQIIYINNAQLQTRLYTKHTKIYKNYSDYIMSVIMVGTDIAIIDESSFDKFSLVNNTSYSPKHYATNILGYIQPHPSRLHSSQYNRSSMLVNNKEMVPLLNEIPEKLQKALDLSSILIELANSMIGEKSSTIQLICPYICTQLWYIYQKNYTYVYNFNAIEKHTIMVNNIENQVYQFSSLTQTFDNIQIGKEQSQSDYFQIINYQNSIKLISMEGKYNLSSRASTTLNREVMSVLMFQLMQQFIQLYSRTELTQLDGQREFSSLSKLFKRRFLLSYLNILLFMMILTQQPVTAIKNIQLIILHGQTGSSNIQFLCEGNIEDINTQKLLEQIYRIPGKHEMMLMPQTIDFAIQNFNNDVRIFPSAEVWNHILKDSIESAIEDFKILQEQKIIDSRLIVVIYFERSRLLNKITEQSEVIFDFILTFHGYEDIGLEWLYGCQVLPVYCDNHIKEVLQQRITPFGLKNAVQIELDQCEPFTLIHMGQVLIRDVDIQQTAEREICRKLQNNIAENQIDSYVYQVQQLDNKYIKKLELLQQGFRLFKLIMHMDTQYIQIITNIDDIDTLLVNLRQINISLLPDRMTLQNFAVICNSQYCQNLFQSGISKFKLPLQTVTIDLIFDLDLIVVKSNVQKLEKLIEFIKWQNTNVLIVFKNKVELLLLLDFLNLELVSVYQQRQDFNFMVVAQQKQNMDQMTMTILNQQIHNFEHLPLTLQKSNQINMRLLKLDIVYQDKLADEDIYEFIDRQRYLNNKIQVEYLSQIPPIFTCYNSLLKEIQVTKSVIYNIKDKVLHLANENQCVSHLVHANGQIIADIKGWGSDYAYLLINLIKSNKINTDNKFLFRQTIEVQFNMISQLFKKQKNTSSDSNQCKVKLHGELYTDQQRDHIKENGFVQVQGTLGYQILCLFCEIKVVVIGIIQDEQQDILQLIAVE
ncbi:hypothetical protein SS50377_21421 [Spironucleus salmonicida]|uniref:Uncharacterized protein n=1 Tax=Spironucleus salmonicida TaxID=348837 RepID=V6LD77_9EUKA|nr:hypothetical protein SS50377_21421 [Spironucleus salmonicida]|eukprot:EST42455.1 Hypothetical protein SS50377_18024 [Spironucleus salmonicida]